MTYPKKFFWIYLTTISFFLIGLQHLQKMNVSRTTSCKKVKRSCSTLQIKEHKRHIITEFSTQKRVVAPMPISSTMIKHNDFHYSIFSDKEGLNSGLARYKKVVKTKVKVGKTGDIKAISIIGYRGHCNKKRSREFHQISNQKFIPGKINGQATDLWVNVDFRY